MNDLDIMQNAMQHEILLNLIQSCDDEEMVFFILDNMDDFKFEDLAIRFWNRCAEKLRIQRLDKAIDQFMNSTNEIARICAVNEIKELI